MVHFVNLILAEQAGDQNADFVIEEVKTLSTPNDYLKL
jgi:hypothetical protein